MNAVIQETKRQKHPTNFLGSSRKAIIFIIAVFFLMATIFGRVVIQNDGITYYALTLSLIEDHDFDLTNQNEKLPDLRITTTRDGKSACLYSCGFAVLYFPVLWLTMLFANTIPTLAEWRPYAQNVFFPLSHSLAIFWGTLFFGLSTILLAWKLLRDIYQASAASAVFITLAFFVGTPLIFYTFTTPSFSHAPDAFLITASCFLAVNRKPNEHGRELRNVLLGLILALSTSLRNNNFVLIPLFTGYVLWLDRKEGWRRIAITAIEVFAGALPVGILQAFYNHGQYGSIFATGHRIELVEDFTKHLGSGLRFYPILIDPVFGNFVWSPITAIALAGLFVGAFRKRPVAIFSLLAITVTVLSLRFAGMISPGASFGQRYLTHLYIFWIIGFYEVFQMRKRTIAVLGTVTCLWGFLLFNVYYINVAYPEGRKTFADIDPRSLTPSVASKKAAINYDSFRHTTGSASILKFWWVALESNPYPNLQYIIRHPQREMKNIRKKRRKRLSSGMTIELGARHGAPLCS